MLVVEITDTDELLLHQHDFPVLGFLLRAQPVDLFIELLNALAELRLLARAAVDADVEQFALTGKQRRHVGIGRQLQ